MHGSKKNLPKSRSVDDMDIIVQKATDDPDSPQKTIADGPLMKDHTDNLAAKHLSLIATRTKNVERKNKKMKSRKYLIQVILT